MTHEFLLDRGMRDESVSLGLYRAMRTLWDVWVDGDGAGCRESRAPVAARDGEARRVAEPRRPLWVPMFTLAFDFGAMVSDVLLCIKDQAL